MKNSAATPRENVDGVYCLPQRLRDHQPGLVQPDLPSVASGGSGGSSAIRCWFGVISPRESQAGCRWRLLAEQTELHRFRIGKATERPKAADRVSAKAGPDRKSMFVLGRVVYNRYAFGRSLFLEGMVCVPVV